MRLFVYGSLMRGGRHAARMAGARFVGAAVTTARYTLFDRGAYPGLVGRGTSAVAGELYEVDDAALPALDEFEGPECYRRQPVLLADGSSAQAYFLIDPPAGRPIPSGDWRRR